MAEVAGLSVGSCAFRQDHSDPWTHGTIPNGPTYLVTYEVRPNESNLEAGDLGGAFVNCWIVAETLESAICTAVDEVTAAGWEIVERTRAEVVAAAECGSDPYFRQAQIDGIVLVVHTFPKHELDLS